MRAIIESKFYLYKNVNYLSILCRQTRVFALPTDQITQLKEMSAFGGQGLENLYHLSERLLRAGPAQ